ncbi:MAG: hypothetical protein KTR31_08560 [Myxococcales bacterium]|nr:hypothetical protein [Myxococcales bacterium]
MSTSFLFGFADALVTRLRADGLVEIEARHAAHVKAYLANYLGTTARGHSLLSSIEAALLDCPEVAELYADLDALKAVVEDLR